LLQELIKHDDTEVTGICFIQLKKDTFFLITGWNRQISMFPDDNKSQTYPTFTWPNISKGKSEKWHKDDILTLAFHPPSTLVTASYGNAIF
jgi:WD40 repeat protein